MLNRKNKKRLSVTQKLSNITEIPFDMATGLPFIKMYSNRELIVEDAGKLIHFDDCCVKVRQKDKTVTVEGRNIKLRCLANNDMSVTGYITSLSFEQE